MDGFAPVREMKLLVFLFLFYVMAKEDMKWGLGRGVGW